MTKLTDIQLYAVSAIGNGWITTTGYGDNKCCFITPDGAVESFDGCAYIDMPNNRYAVVKPEFSRQDFRREGIKEKDAVFISGPEMEKPEWSYVNSYSSKWSVSDNDVFSAGLNDIRRNRDLKARPDTLYKALVPRQFVKSIFDLTACNHTIVVYAMMSGQFQAIKTPIKDPRSVVARDGMTILIFGDKPKPGKQSQADKWNNKDRHFCIIDNPFV